MQRYCLQGCKGRVCDFKLSQELEAVCQSVFEVICHGLKHTIRPLVFSLRFINPQFEQHLLAHMQHNCSAEGYLCFT